MTPHHDILTSELCAEIDYLREQVKYHKERSDHWQQAHNKLCQDSIKASQQMQGGILALILKGRLK